MRSCRKSCKVKDANTRVYCKWVSRIDVEEELRMLPEKSDQRWEGSGSQRLQHCRHTEEGKPGASRKIKFSRAAHHGRYDSSFFTTKNHCTTNLI